MISNTFYVSFYSSNKMEDQKFNFKKILNDYILKPQYLVIKFLREFLGQMGLQDPMDHFVYKNIEDPLFSLWFSQAYKYEVFGDEVIPKEEEGACVFASNHQSIMDPLTSGLAIVHNSKRMAYQLTKSELGEDPLLGNFVTMNQVIYIKRGENDINALDQCVNALVNENRPVLVYPEGTYGPGNGELLNFKSGAARIAWDAQVPIIPMATYGIDKVLPKGNFKKFKPNGFIKIKFGEKMELDELFPNNSVNKPPKREDYKKATNLIQERVQGLWNDMNAQYNLYF